jgi:hypothetical protein
MELSIMISVGLLTQVVAAISLATITFVFLNRCMKIAEVEKKDVAINLKKTC